jgi:aerobic-type carbon monoxide dehydrogenase small subunit (CoxS/CutS family)
MNSPIMLTVNKEKHHLEVKPNLILVDLLRDDLGLTGT